MKRTSAMRSKEIVVHLITVSSCQARREVKLPTAFYSFRRWKPKILTHIRRRDMITNNWCGFSYNSWHQNHKVPNISITMSWRNQLNFLLIYLNFVFNISTMNKSYMNKLRWYGLRKKYFFKFKFVYVYFNFVLFVTLNFALMHR